MTNSAYLPPDSPKIQNSTQSLGPTAPAQNKSTPLKIEGKITPSLNQMSTHKNTVPVSRDASLGITLLAQGTFARIPNLPAIPPNPPGIPVPKIPTSAPPAQAFTATQSSKSFQKGNLNKESTRTRSETSTLGSRILMGKKGQEEDVFGEDKPPSDQQAHQNNTNVSEKNPTLDQAQQKLQREIAYRNIAENKQKVLADELNTMPPHLKTEQLQHQYNKQEGVVYAARLNVLNAGIEVVKATPQTPENKTSLATSLAKLEAEAKGLHFLCLQTGVKVTADEVKMLKETLNTLKDETAIRNTKQTLQNTENLKVSLHLSLLAEQMSHRAERIDRRGNAAIQVNAKEITVTLAKSPENIQNTAAKTKETCLDTLSTSEIPPTETVKPVALASTKLEAAKTQFYHQAKEVVTSEKTFTAQLGVMLSLKEMILNPNSPDGIKAKQQIDAFYKKMTPAQKEEFDKLFSKIDSKNLELIKKFSEEINQNFEKPYSELTSVEAKLEANAEELKKPDLSKERKTELNQEKARLTIERDQLAIQLSDIFSSTKIPNHIFTAVTDHFQAVEKFGQFINNNNLKSEWMGVLEGFKEARVGKEFSSSPEFQLYASFTTGVTDIFGPVFQRYCKYAALADGPSKTLNGQDNTLNEKFQSAPEYASTAKNALEGFQYFSKKTMELNTLQAHMENTKKAQSMAATVNTNPDKSGRLVGEGEVPAQRQRLKSIRGLAPGNRNVYTTATATNQKPGATIKKEPTEAETLKSVRDTLQAGLTAQNALIEKKSEMLKEAKTDAERNKLSEEIQSNRVVIADLTKSMSKINNSVWATAVDAQSKTRSSMNLEAINRTNAELGQTLNMHNPPMTVTVNAPGTPLNELNVTNERAKNVMLGAGFEAKQQALQKLEAQGKKQIENFIDDIAKPKTYEKGSATETAASNNLRETDARIVRTEDKITTELLHLETLVRAHPEFAPAFSKLSDALMEKAGRPPLSAKGYAELESDLKQISEGIRMVEAAVMHKEEMGILAQPERVALREAMHEAIRIGEKSNELVQLKETVKTARDEDLKLTMNASGDILTTKRASNVFGVDTKKYQGTSSEAAATVHLMLKKLDDTNDAGLRSQVNEIITLMKTEGSWTNAVIKEHASVRDTLTKLEDKLKQPPRIAGTETLTVAAPPLNVVKELFDPPRNPQLEKAFLNSSHLFISELIKADGTPGIGGTPDAQFFGFLKAKLNDPETTLYQKQQTLNLAQKWVENPFINSGKVKDREADIRELATLAAGSATMNASAARLLETLETAIATPAAQPAAGTKSVLHTLENIANGSPKPGSPEYQQAVTELANSITAQSTASFKAINSTDFAPGKWGPNLTQATNEFNIMAQFVQLSILEPTTAHSGLDLVQQQQQSAKVMEFFVHVQAELISPQRPLANLDGFMAINAGLNSAAIKRLSAVEALLPNEVVQKQKEHEKLVSTDKNSGALRTKMNDLSASNQSFIPYIGLLRTDTTFANDGNKTINPGNKELNSKKVVIIGNIIDSAGEMNHNITSAPRPSFNLAEVTTIGSSYTDNTAFEKSLKLNPRPPSRPTGALPNKVSK